MGASCHQPKGIIRMRMAKFSRVSAALLAGALVATACSSDPDETTTDPSSSDSETSTPVADSEYDWSDVRRRQAVSMAIDRQLIVDVIFNGTQTAADDFWPATFAGYRGGCENMEFNPERAKQLWDEAGGDAGPLTMWFNSGAGHEDWVEAAANMLKENLGIADVQFQSLEFADYLDKMDNAEVNGPFRLGWGMDYPSPGNFLAVLHGTAGGYNRTGYANPAFDELAAKGDALALADAIPFYQQASDILCEDMPFAPMRFGALQGVWGEGVSDVAFDAFDRLELGALTDANDDGEISMYICEPQAQLAGPINNDSCGNEVLNALFTGLVTLDSESGEVNNAVASSFESPDGGTTWNVALNDGWTFHDGSPVTASSFVDAWNWGAYGPNGAKNSYYYGIP
ncbi:MAG: ABC-type oligopeptide transport system substrate-binding subunit, partial [Glaciecola sp.]